MAFQLTEEQRRVVEHRDSELLVSAAAGSGKTRVLVERLLDRVINEGVDIDRFLVITFTRAAAAELRERVARELNDRLAQNPKDRWLRRQSTLVYKAPISTIHSLCGDLLREFGHTINLDPDYRLMDEGEALMLRDSVLEDVVEQRYETIVPGDDFTRLLDQFSAGKNDEQLLKIAAELHWKLQAHPHPMQWLDEMEQMWSLKDGVQPEDTPWGRILLENTAAEAEFTAMQLLSAMACSSYDKGLYDNYFPSLQDAKNQFDLLAETARSKGWNGVRALGHRPFLTAGRKKMDQSLPEVAVVKRIRNDAKKKLEELTDRFAQSGEEAMEELREIYPAVRGLFALIRDFDRAFREEKRRKNLLDFNDLEHRVVELLQHEELPGLLSERYAEVMVDEYQDTNAVQNAIFHAISGGGKTLFQVGDVKQSIYRFRMADPTIFLEKYASFAETGEGPRRMSLTANFRSRQQVLGAVNDLFRTMFSLDVGELEYTSDQWLNPGATFPEEDASCWNTEFDVLFLQKADEEEGTEKIPKDLQEARFVAGRIKKLFSDGFRVTEGDHLRPIRPGDIAVLLRSPGSQKHHYAQAFREVGMPWQSEGSENLLDALEIQVALSLLQVVDNPRQDVPLIAALRSPVWRMSADRLAELRAESPDTDFYTALCRGGERGEADCVGFLKELKQLRLAAVDRPAHELLWLLYQKTDLIGIFSALDAGAERRGNLMLLYEYAREFEQTGHKGLYRFLRHLRRLGERGERLPGVASGQADSAVTLLSIHRSKGLEFPVVIVAGLNREFNRMDSRAPLLFHPKLGVGPKRRNEARRLIYPTVARSAIEEQQNREMLSEEMRLLYVAMTRAKDKLILCCALPNGEKKLSGLMPWNPIPPEWIMNSSSVGEWVLMHALSRPEGQKLREISGGGGALDVQVESRWDIQLFTLEQGQKNWIAMHREKAEPARVEDNAWNYVWHYPHETATVTPSKLTATQLKGRALDAETAETAPVQYAVPVFRRPRFLQQETGLTGTERGTATHLAMQYMDFRRAGSLAEIQAELDRMEARRFLTKQQRECVSAEKLWAFFDSEIGRQVLAAPKLEREFKFSLLRDGRDFFPEVGTEEQVLFQGVVDCWFEDGDGTITVLDFKTDRRPDPERYRPQVAAYGEALERIIGKPVKRRVLYFFADNSAYEL